MTNILLCGCSGRMGAVVSDMAAADEQTKISVGVDALGEANGDYPAYEKLLASYTKTLTAVKNMGGASEEVSSLDSLRNKFKVAK